ncbi:MAG: fibronectin-binding domain-containing protein [Candidatus Latescibacteria bacterium]|nr:fibronectin-binding domain-containing protein [Candidatus Latescibacterota bacterium]
MDYYTILAQRALLNKILVGQNVDTARLFGSFALYIGFENDRALKLSSTPGMPCLLAVEKRYIPVRNAKDWHIGKFSGATLESIEITHGDRVLTFTFDSGIRLVFEMTGRHANLILVDREGIVIVGARKVTAHQSRVREIKSGVPYVPPPYRDFPDLLWASLPLMERKLREQDTCISAALAQSICCGSRLCALEALARTEIDPELPASDINPDDIFRLLKTVAEMVDIIEKGGEGGTIVYDSAGLPRDVFPLRMVSAAPGDEYKEDINEAATRYLRERETGLEKRSLINTIAATLSDEERNLKLTMKKVERESGRQSEPELLEHKGNTILANLHNIKKGMSSVTLPDPYGEGTMEIVLNPALDGPSNAERLFTRVRKLRAAGHLAEERIAGIKKRLGEIESEKKSLETLDDIKELKTFAAAYTRKAAKGRTHDIDRPFPRRFKSVSGLDIIIGRNNKENDELVRWAGKNDIWLHAQGVEGSHVILRSPGKKQKHDHRSIELAASITAYYSKARTSAVVPVAYTLVKYVVKRKGQGPGQVTYTREKVIFTEPGLPEKNK